MEYFGPEEVQIGDGNGLIIKHVGHSSFHSPFHSQKLDLKSLLHVPEITKNGVSKFCIDNGVFFDFHSNSCFVKNQITNEVPLEGKLRNGLYMFDKYQIKLRELSKCNSSQLFSSSQPKVSNVSCVSNVSSQPCAALIYDVSKVSFQSCNLDFSSFATIIFVQTMTLQVKASIQ